MRRKYRFVGGHLDGQTLAVPKAAPGDKFRMPLPDDPFKADKYVLMKDGQYHFEGSVEIPTLGTEDGRGVLVAGVINYVAGCIRRERERVAEILTEHHVDRKVISSLLSERDDPLVFRWLGPRNNLRDSLYDLDQLP